MTTYPISDASEIAAAMADPEGDTVLVTKINGVAVDWVANSGTEIVALDEGAAHVHENMLTDPPEWVNTDPTNYSGYPADGQTRTVGSFTYHVSDGTTEVGPFTYTVEIVGRFQTPPPTPLQFTTLPALSGTPQPGNTLTTDNGTVTGGTGPYSYAYEWKDGDTPAPNDTGAATYGVTSADNGATLLHANVIVTDALGAMVVGASNNVSVNVPLANQTKPYFTGSPTEGSTLTIQPGYWVGTGTITVTGYQIKRNGVAIPGATGPTYVLQAADVGAQLTVTETVSDANGSASVTSDPTTIYAAGSTNEDVVAQVIMDEFASHPDKGWPGWTDETGFTVVTCATWSEVMTQFNAWATGTPNTSKVKVKCAWNGLNPTSTTAYITATLAGPIASKLTAGTQHRGYDIGPGGFWIEGAAGFSPIINARLIGNGIPRFMLSDIAVSAIGDPARPANQTKIPMIDFRATGSASFPNQYRPLNGCLALKRVNIGLFDNRLSDMNAHWRHRMKGVHTSDAYSVYCEDVRLNGTLEGFTPMAWYTRLLRCERQQGLGDFFHKFGFASASRATWHWDTLSLDRDLSQVAAASGFHTDRIQQGSQGETIGAYYTLVERSIIHALSSVAVDSGSQGVYNAAANPTTKFETCARDLVWAISAYNILTGHDPSGTGRHVARRVIGMRAGLPQEDGKDTVPQHYTDGQPNNGGSTDIAAMIITQIDYKGAAPLTLGPNIWYMDPRAGVGANGTGLTQNSPLRPEAIFTNLGITRDVNGMLNFTIPGEAAVDYATAFYALADAFEPVGGYEAWGMVNPENWIGAPVRP